MVLFWIRTGKKRKDWAVAVKQETKQAQTQFVGHEKKKKTQKTNQKQRPEMVHKISLDPKHLCSLTSFYLYNKPSSP